MRVIAFDPGEQTGVATGTIDGNVLTIDLFTWDRWMDAAYRFRRGAEEFDHCVYESWKLTETGARTLRGSDMPWCQFIGMMKMVCHDNKITLSVQEPAEKYVIDARMGGTDYLPKGEVEHHRDALRHLIKFAVEKHSVTTIQYDLRTVEVPEP